MSQRRSTARWRPGAEKGTTIISPYEEKGFRGPVTDVRIRFVNKTGRTSADDRIHYFGGINADGSRWKLTQEGAIAGIEDGRWRFWMFRRD